MKSVLPETIISGPLVPPLSLPHHPSICTALSRASWPQRPLSSDAMATDMNFPNVWTRIFSATVHYVGSCMLTFVLARRTAFENLDALRGWRELGAAKLSVIMAFTDSLLFLLLTGILTHGAGLELSHAACSTAFFACVFLYASSKVFIYNFLSMCKAYLSEPPLI